MPGYVIHMAVASRILEEKGITDSSFTNAFLLGNIIPDSMARDRKKESHFWDDVTYGNLNRIPNINDFLAQYGDKLNDPFVLGYYTHLMLDNLFVTEYWSQHFDMLDKDMSLNNSYDQVYFFRIKRTGEIISRERFLSEELYYGDYDRMNPLILEQYSVFLPTKGIDINKELPIVQINAQAAAPVIENMLENIRCMLKGKDNMEGYDREELKVFELEHIFNLMDKVVSNVCEII